MPKAAKHFAVSRQWQMLNLIPTRESGITVRELAACLAEDGFCPGVLTSKDSRAVRGLPAPTSISVLLVYAQGIG
jgi:hypothetical protein